MIPGKTTCTAADWAIGLLDRLAELGWGLPRAIISDRDRKFVSALWKEIFRYLNVGLLYSAAWHPQADGQSERSNQTAEIALRYYIATLEDIRTWPTVIPRMTASLNNSTKYSSTSKAPTEVIFGFRTREALDLLKLDYAPTPGPPPAQPAPSVLAIAAYPVRTRQARITNPPASQDQPAIPASQDQSTAQTPSQDQPAIQLSQDQSTTQTDPGQPNMQADQAHQSASHRPATQASRSPLAILTDYRPGHVDAQDAIAFASIAMKDYYDSKHLAIFFEVGNLVNLRLHRGYRVPGITSKKIGPQLVGPFRILERIGRLAYRLELPDNMLIHDVISVAHLEPATDPQADPYQRHRIQAPAVVVDGYEEFEIEKLLQKRRIRRGHGWSTQYLVRWAGYGPEFDEWMPERRLANAPELVQDYERLFGQASGLAS